MAVSKTIDDIFSSEVDEKEVNALIGSLETKLAPQNPKAVSGSLQDTIVSVNHVNESATLPAQTGHVGLTTVKAEPGGSIHSNAVRQTMQESQLGGAKTGHNHESGSSSILQTNNGTESNEHSNHGVSGTAVGNVKSETGTHSSPSSGPTPGAANPQVAVTNPPTAATLGIGQQDTTQVIQTHHQQTLPGNTKQNDSAGGIPVSALNPNVLNQLRTTSGNDQQIVKVVSVPSAVHSHNANAKLSSDAGGNVNNSTSSAKEQLQARQQALAGSASNDQSGAMKPRIVVQPSMATVPTVPTTIPAGSVAVGNANQKVVTINVASPGIPTTGRSGQYVVNAVSGTPKAVSPHVIAQTVRMPTGQHVIAPRAQMGAPVQIRLPPGTSLPPGVVLINKGGTVQAVMGNPAAIQAHVTGSPGIAYRHVQPCSQIVTSSAQPGRVLSSGSATTIVNSSQITQTTRAGSPVVISSNVPVVRGVTSAAVSVNPQVTAKTSVTVMGKSHGSSASATTASSAGSGSHGVMSPGAMDNVKKCKNFLTTLIRLASNANQPPQTVMNVKKLVQNLIDAKIEPEEFTQKLQKELNSSPQPYLVPFLKRSLPLLRQSMQRSHSSSNISSLMTPIPASPVVAPTATSSADAAATSSSSSPVPSKVAKAVSMAKSASLGTTITPSTTSTTVTTSRSSSSKQSQQTSQKQPSGKSSKSSSSPGRSPSPLGKPGVSKPATPSSKSSSKSSSRSSGSKTGTSKSSSSRSASSKKDKNKDSSATFSSRDDDDINDVASMAGVNLSEESARILATNEAFVGTQLRSCEDEKFLHLSPLRARMSKICTKHGVDSAAPAVLDLVSQAVQERLKQVVEKLSVISQHRLEIYRNDARYQVMNDVRSQMKFFEQLDTLERKRRDEQEREILLRAAKSRSKQEDPEQLRLKQKAREMQQMELEQLRQQEANLTALAAIGPRKKRKLDSPTSNSSPGVSSSSTSLLSTLTSSGPNTTPFLRTQFRRIKRVNMRDLLFLLEQEPETKKSTLLYKTYLS